MDSFGLLPAVTFFWLIGAKEGVLAEVVTTLQKSWNQRTEAALGGERTEMLRDQRLKFVGMMVTSGFSKIFFFGRLGRLNCVKV